MSLSRNGTAAAAPLLSPEARAALTALLQADTTSGFLIRSQHGIQAYQELRAAAAGLVVKPLGHDVEPHDPGTFRVRSRTAPDEAYVVDLEEWTCGCRGYEVRRHCGHLDSCVAYTLLP